LAAGVPAAAPPVLSPDEQLLQEEKIKTDGPSLLEYLRNRTSTAEKPTRIATLIRLLGDDSFLEREKASEALLEMGSIAIPFLREATRDRDREIRRRAERALETLERRREAGHVSAVVRVLSQRETAGMVPVLLAFLPDAQDGFEVEEIRLVLLRAALAGGKPDPALIAALTHRESLRRGIAAEVVARSGSAAQRGAVRKLLADPEPLVRLRAAVGLAHAKDKDSVPALIVLAAELPLEQRGPAEEILYRLAGETAPDGSFGEAEADRKKVRAAWEDWWARQHDRIDLGRLEKEGYLGYTMAILFHSGSVSVVEFGRDKQRLWSIKGLDNAVDAHILPGNRVLIAEYGARRVTERTFENKVVWEVKMAEVAGYAGEPIACQRLADGHTFIVTPSSYVEVDRRGKPIRGRSGLSLRIAYRYRDGRVALVDHAGTYVRFDPSGREEKRFATRISIGNTLGGIDFLPDGGLLVSRSGKVVQMDRNGKEVWNVAVAQPYCPTRLGNGNTLVACTASNEIFEFDRGGKKVLTIKVDTTPWLARRR
jgi:hypothetical protein